MSKRQFRMLKHYCMELFLKVTIKMFVRQKIELVGTEL